MARPERVAFGLSLSSSSSELMNARMTMFPRVNGITVILIIVTFIRFPAVSACPLVILCQSPGISHCLFASSERTLLLQAWMSYNCLHITFSLLLLFKCCFSPWWFKYLISSGTRCSGFLSFVTSSHTSVKRLSSYGLPFTSLLSFALSSTLFFF